MDTDAHTGLIRNFETKRLSVRHWAFVLGSVEGRLALAQDLTVMLSPAVLKYLPPSLYVEQNTDAVLGWINERAAQSDVYLVNDARTEALVGLLILVSGPQPGGVLNVHFGYLFTEAAWGKGYASEMIAGLLQVARTKASMILVGGVAKGNGASAHILRKCGFSLEQSLSDESTDVFALTLTRD